MKLLHVTESHEAAAGGVTTVVQDLSRCMADAGASVRILATGTDPMAPPDGVELTTVPPAPRMGAWRWSPELPRAIDRLLDEWQPDVVHLHGAWLGAQWYAARAARRRGIPTVGTLHGMLEPYHWSDRGMGQLLKKKVYWSLMGRPAFQGVTVLHAITSLERRHLRTLVGHPRTVVIPNAVDLDAVDAALARLGPAPGAPPRRIAFLGRLHVKKGVDLLVEAFGASGLPAPWELVIMGPEGDPAYLEGLRRAAAASPASDRITFVPPGYGDERWRFLRDAWVVAVPSRSEVVAMVNLEASAVGTPTITTTETGLEDWMQGGGLVVPPEVMPLAEALARVAAESPAERLARGEASRRLMEWRYGWHVVGATWQRLYGTLAAGRTDVEGTTSGEH